MDCSTSHGQTQLTPRVFPPVRWKLLGYSHKLDADKKLWRLILTLEQLPDQPAMKGIVKIPKPSQLDDWRLYEQIEESEIKALFGEQGVHRWNENRGQEKRERDSWRRACEFRASVGVPSAQGGMTSTRSITPNLQVVPEEDARVKKAVIDIARNQEMCPPG